jgi:SAM-dependent methyltransferase
MLPPEGKLFHHRAFAPFMNKCRICHNEAANLVYKTREMMFGLRDEFIYFECARCGCVQIQEVPENLARYYPDNYYSFRKQGALTQFLKRCWARYSYDGSSLLGRMAAVLMGKNEAVESVARARIKRDAAVLDVGCGNGDLLRLLHALGFTSLTGVDPFLDADQATPEGIHIWKKDLSQMQGGFDVIMLHHSFEHMTEPVAILANIARLLKPGGVAIIRVPIAGSFAWKHYGVNWVQLDPPRHIFLPSVKSIKLLSENSGLRLGNVIHESSDFQFRGSEQYLLDIPLMDKRSYVGNPWKQYFPTRTIRKYRARAAELNRNGEGDSACFYLHKDAR